MSAFDERSSIRTGDWIINTFFKVAIRASAGNYILLARV